MARFTVFGQELYFDESIRAIETFSDAFEDDRSQGSHDLPARIAELLPQPSEKTRLRIASKIVQRFFKATDGKSRAGPFLRLVNSLKSELARRDLLYWRTGRTDTIVAAIAREILYPYFVLGALPKGYDEASFRMANTATLFSVDHVISRDFAVEYAKKVWNFGSARTVTLALRIMRQAGVLDAVSVKLGRRHVLGYFPQPHPLQPEVFAYCMHEEFFEGKPARLPSLDQAQNGDCVKLFFLNRLQADALLKTLERRKLIEYTTPAGGRRVRFTPPDQDSLVRTLIGK